MRIAILFLSIIITIILLHSCNSPFSKKTVVIMQPFDDIPTRQVQDVYSRLQTIYDTIVIRRAIPLPAFAYTSARNRYRADSLIDYLINRVGDDTIIVGLTSKDISTTKGKYHDYGIMGLAYTPGNSCIVSTFRLNKNNLSDQFFKVTIHELGHTTGLPHCKEKRCYLRDADGSNPLNEETSFCHKCQSYLQRNGWRL